MTKKGTSTSREAKNLSGIELKRIQLKAAENVRDLTIPEKLLKLTLDSLSR